MGMARGPIPFTAIDAYGRRFDIASKDEFADFAEDIRVLDRLFLDVTEKKKPDN